MEPRTIWPSSGASGGSRLSTRNAARCSGPTLPSGYGSDPSLSSKSRLRIQDVFTNGPQAEVHPLTFVACLPECLTAPISRSSSLVIPWKHTTSS